MKVNKKVRPVSKTNRDVLQEALKREISYSLLFGYRVHQEDLERLLAIAKVEVLPTVAFVVRLGSDPFSFELNQIIREQRDKMFYTLESVLKQEQDTFLGRLGRHNILMVMVSEREIAVLLPISGLGNREEILCNSKSYGEHIRVQLEQALGYTIQIGIGRYCDDFRLLTASYTDACRAIAYSFYETSGAMIHIDDIEKVRDNGIKIPFIQYESLLLDSLRKGHWEQFHQISRKLMADVAKGKSTSPDILKVRMLELSTILTRSVIDIGGDTEKILDFKVRMGDEIQKIQAVTELKNWLRDVFEEISGFAQEKQRNMAAVAVTQAKQYIYMNYAKPISLNQLAKHVLLSPYYLSHAFSEHCGESMSEYLKKVRVTRAQILLRTTNKTVADIAMSVGYLDPNYFTRVFKSFTGKSPQQYRKNK